MPSYTFFVFKFSIHVCVRVCLCVRSYRQQSTALLWRAAGRCWASSIEPHRRWWRRWWGWWGRWSSKQQLPEPKLEEKTNTHTDKSVASSQTQTKNHNLQCVLLLKLNNTQWVATLKNYSCITSSTLKHFHTTLTPSRGGNTISTRNMWTQCHPHFHSFKVDFLLLKSHWTLFPWHGGPDERCWVNKKKIYIDIFIWVMCSKLYNIACFVDAEPRLLGLYAAHNKELQILLKRWEEWENNTSLPYHYRFLSFFMI